MTPPRTIDAHLHKWDLRRTPREVSTFVKLLGWSRPLMYWVANRAFPREAADFFGGPDAVLSDYLPHHYQADAADVGVDGFIHVEASWRGSGPMGPVQETRWLEGLDTPLLSAIVGYADLQLGDAVAEVLQAHIEASGRFRGVRYALTHHPSPRVLSACDDPNLIQDASWRRGYAQLGEHGLNFDATVYHHQLDDLDGLARDFPSVPLIVCHAGTPTAWGGAFGGQGQSAGERDAIAVAWRTSMARLAERPNVSVKLSGLAMPILGWGYHQGAAPDAARVADDIRPMVDFLIDRFGADRCMFASNFPIDRISMPLKTLYDAFARVVDERPAEEREALFGGTAARVYQLDSPDDP